MTQVARERQHSSYRKETGQYVPRKFNRVSRERFLRERRQSYLARIAGPPTDTQRAQVASLAQLEWSALQCEAENSLQSMRESREHRRLMLKVLADFERSLEAPKRGRGPRSSLNDILQAG
jgi:hypothetical protein